MVCGQQGKGDQEGGNQPVAHAAHKGPGHHREIKSRVGRLEAGVQKKNIEHGGQYDGSQSKQETNDFTDERPPRQPAHHIRSWRGSEEFEFSLIFLRWHGCKVWRLFVDSSAYG